MANRLSAPERRRQLLDTAVEVFASRGYHGASMNDLAEAAGVTKPVLYQHFASKRELYLELLGELGAALQERIEKAAAAAGGPRRQVEAGFAAYFRFVAEHRSAFALLFGSGARRDDEFADAARRVETAMAEVVASLIEAELDERHRRVLGHGLVGLAEATGRHWVAGGLEPGPDVLARQMADLAWAGLRNVRPVP